MNCSKKNMLDMDVSSVGIVLGLDDIQREEFAKSNSKEKETIEEMITDLKKIGIKMEIIPSGYLRLHYDKGSEGIINWDRYSICSERENA